MTNYDFGQLESIWLQAAQGTKYDSKAWSALMAAIALAESSGNPDAINPNDNGGTQSSWGLWQISLGNHNTPAPNWNNPLENAKLAIGKLDSQGLGAWGTYNSGAYKQFMQGNVPPQPVTDGGGGSGSGSGSNGTPTAQLTGFNPLGWVEHTLNPFAWAGNLITGVTGAASTIGDVAFALAGIVRTLNKLLELFLLLFRPDFWLRVAAFIFGIGAIGAGLYFLKEAL